MTVSTQQTLVLVDLTDAQGHDLGRAIPVMVDYLVETAWYGADADGRHGELRTEYTLLDVHLDAEDAKRLTLGQIEAVLDEARTIFSQRQKRW